EGALAGAGGGGGGGRGGRRPRGRLAPGPAGRRVLRAAGLPHRWPAARRGSARARGPRGDHDGGGGRRTHPGRAGGGAAPPARPRGRPRRRRPERRAHAGRRDGDERQDHHHLPARGDLARGGTPPGCGGDHRLSLRRGDPAGARLAASVRTRCVRVGRGARADVRPLEVETSLTGTRGTLALGAERLAFECRLVGAPHVENILGAAAAAWALGTPPGAISRGLAAAEPPPGRLEQIPGPGFMVVVDYAHS